MVLNPEEGGTKIMNTEDWGKDDEVLCFFVLSFWGWGWGVGHAQCEVSVGSPMGTLREVT